MNRSDVLRGTSIWLNENRFGVERKTILLEERESTFVKHQYYLRGQFTQSYFAEYVLVVGLAWRPGELSLKVKSNSVDIDVGICHKMK